ncbi:YeeE/YedE family protein [Tabrizicola sp.]|uniref:YeeE/YedE family protein n=1 Tax=Tabrizicola sp. TaxID=2005166 RepID=UPI00286B30A5|nr:YeeE/YedE family protein [Tabrizicola sp.]
MGLFENLFGTLLLGGALIGLAAGLLTVLTGRVMGASGMIGSLVGGAEGVAATSIAFIGGIVVAPLIMTSLGFPTQIAVEADWPFLVAGGLLVGIGSRFGGASLGGALTGMARRSGHAATIFGAIVVGAAIAVYLQRFLGGGGVE